MFDKLLKYLAGGALLGSVYALVWYKGMDPNVFISMVTGALTALGLYNLGGKKDVS